MEQEGEKVIRDEIDNKENNKMKEKDKKEEEYDASC